MNNKIVIHAWAVQKKEGRYYLPYTHWVYLNEIVKYYDEIVLLSTCKFLKQDETTNYLDINFSNVSVYELPYSNGYLGAIKHFFSYRKAYKEIKDVTTYYARYPVPFGWLQKIYGKNKKRIIHYVGDPVDAAKNNPNFSALKRKVLITAFKPENALYNWACKGARVFTNGYHIAERLSKNNIKAIPIVSSTLTERDFFFKEKRINKYNTKFIYLGNLRTAKGVETILRAFKLYNEKYENSSFKIIGSGEFEYKLQQIVKNENIKNVDFLGRIDDRDLINYHLRDSDIFLFGSLSEGSPRVVLEAIANGLIVISTPVGSLPNIFENEKNILFADFNNPYDFYEKINLITQDEALSNIIRKESYNLIQNFTIQNFLKKIFDEK